MKHAKKVLTVLMTVMMALSLMTTPVQAKGMFEQEPAGEEPEVTEELEKEEESEVVEEETEDPEKSEEVTAEPEEKPEVEEKQEEETVQPETTSEGDEEDKPAAEPEKEKEPEESEKDEKSEDPVPVTPKPVKYNGVTVTVSYLSDAFGGKNVTLVVGEAGAAEKAALEKLGEYKAVDISFVDENGNKVQPEDGKKISVSLKAEGLKTEGDIEVVHVDANGDIESVDAATATSNEVTKREKTGEATTTVEVPAEIKTVVVNDYKEETYIDYETQTKTVEVPAEIGYRYVLKSRQVQKQQVTSPISKLFNSLSKNNTKTVTEYYVEKEEYVIKEAHTKEITEQVPVTKTRKVLTGTHEETQIVKEAYSYEEKEDVYENVTYSDVSSSFEAGSFSVYAILDGDSQSLQQARVIYYFLSEIQEDGTAEPYSFVNKTGEYVDYQIVKNDELLEDPGTPATSLEKNFLGWFVVTKNQEDGTYSFPTGGQAIDFSQTPPVTTTITDGDKIVYVAPRYGKAFIVTFWDNAKGSPEDQMHIVAKRVVYLDEGATYASVRVDDVTVPTPSTKTLSGWTSDDYKEGQTTYTILEKPIWDEVTKSFNLYPEFSDGHWLRFAGGPSGSGAGYREAIFVTAATTASELTNLGKVEREGYTFAGWYYGGFDGTEAAADENGVAINPSNLLERVLEGDVTLYGKWAGNQVTYRVATWFENADDDNYSFGEVTSATGEAGKYTNVSAPEVRGFTAETIEQQEIKGDGTTIVNVYYKRNVYEVTFYALNYIRTTQGYSETVPQYGYVGGSYVSLTYSNRRWYYYQNGWRTYNGYRYITEAADQYNDLTISAKYGADIHDQWPSFKGYTAAWYNNSSTSGAWVISIATMPLDGAQYYEKGAGSVRADTIFRVQNVDGSNTFEDYMGSPYLTDSTSVAKTADDYRAIKGFKVNAASQTDANSIRAIDGGDPNAVYDPNFTTSCAIGTTYGDGTLVRHEDGYQYYTLYFYYLREQYSVSFNTQKSAAPNPTSLTGIYYEANIASTKATQIASLNEQYIPGETTVEVTGEGTYIFQGWYDNAACMGEPFNFDQKMPAGNIELFAKWERVYYLIQIDPNGGELLPSINEVTYTWLQYGQKIERYNIRRDFVEAPSDYSGTKYYYYKLLASEDEHRHDESGYYWSDYRKGFYIREDLINDKDAFMAAYPSYAGEYADANWAMIQAHLDKNVAYMPATTNDNYAFVGWYKANINSDDTLTYTNDVYDFDAIVTKDTAIYAKWRRSGLFSIQYHTQNGVVSSQINGSLVATDSSYADQATTNIAYTPTHITSTDGKTYVFVGWKVADPQGFDPEDPGAATLGDTVYKQGDAYTVDAAKADSGHYIHLVAIYEPAETSEVTLHVTSVTFVPNFPTDSTGRSGQETKAEGVPINTAIDLSKDSFKYDTIDPETNQKVEVEQSIPTFDTAEYEQIGWNTMADGSGTAFKMNDVVGVDNLDKDNNTKDNKLYAVWDYKKFYVYHSSNGTVEAISFGSLTDGKYDITSLVKPNYIYGGYYADYLKKGDYDIAKPGVYTKAVPNSAPYQGGLGPWRKTSAFTSNLIDGEGGKGTAMTPVANHTYFLKEVPAGFLATKICLIYDVYNDNTVVHNYLISVVDDNNYNDISLYAKDISTGNRIKFSAAYSIHDSYNNTDVKISARDTFNKTGYIAVWKPNLATQDFEFAASFTTPDGITAEGEYIRMVKVGNGRYITDNLEWDSEGFGTKTVDNSRITNPGQILRTE